MFVCVPSAFAMMEEEEYSGRIKSKLSHDGSRLVVEYTETLEDDVTKCTTVYMNLKTEEISVSYKGTKKSKIGTLNRVRSVSVIEDESVVTELKSRIDEILAIFPIEKLNLMSVEMANKFISECW